MKHLSMLTVSLALGIAAAQTPPTTPAKDAQANPQADARMGAPAEMKTSTFKGMLVDMECASNSAASPAPAGEAKAASDAGAGCAVSANSSRLGVKLNDGKTVGFDLVGNQRAQDAVKNDKRWNKELSANKPIHVTISGVLNGDKLIVSSIH